MIVDIFIPCFIDQFYPETGNNMVKILEKTGCSINYNVEQTCCGQVAFNAGFWDECKEVGQKFINDFSNDRYVISPSASCVGMVKNHYGELFHNSVLHNEYKAVRKKIYELSDFLTNVMGASDFGARLDAKAVYMDTCHAVHECNIKTGPRALLEKVKGLELFELKDDGCCGFGGMFSVKYSGISTAMAEKKVNDILATGAECVIAVDMSCLMHLDSYIKKNQVPLKVMHLADVIASGWE